MWTRSRIRCPVGGAIPDPGSGIVKDLSTSRQRRPVPCGSAALLILAALVIPLFSMRQAFTDSRNYPATLTTRQATTSSPSRPRPPRPRQRGCGLPRDAG